MQSEFSEIRAWISWWAQPANSTLIWPAVMKMPVDAQRMLPNTTNGGESVHWLLYRACGTQHDLWEGIRCLYMFQREQEQLYEAILGTLKYQSLDILQVPDKQIVSIARYVTAQFQGVKPHPKSKIQWHANDGRAPDTHAFIALAEQHESASQKRNVNRDIDERFAACNTTSTHTQVKSLTPSNPLKITLFLYSWD